MNFPSASGERLLKRYEERLLRDMLSPQWVLAVGDPPPILRVPVEILVHIVNLLTEREAREKVDVRSIGSLRWYFSFLVDKRYHRTDESAV
jgi:hypothetical protein